MVPGRKLLKKQSSLRLAKPEGHGPWEREVLQELDPTDPSFASPQPFKGEWSQLTSPTVTHFFPLSLGPGSFRF